jgi:hypothetical protein
VARHNVTAAAEIDVACLRTPMQRALVMLVVPALLAVSLVVVVPLSGSFVVNINPTVDIWVYSLYLQPIYMAWGYWLCISFFYFSTKRFASVTTSTMSDSPLRALRVVIDTGLSV